MKVRCFWLVSLAVVGACDVPVSETQTEQAITNGTPTTAYPSTVALIFPGGTSAFCTGALIDKRIVLTAAHCLAEGDEAMAQVAFGSDLTTPLARIDILHVENAPGYEPATLTNDVNLLILATDAPVDPIPVWDQPFDDTFIGREVNLVGFGTTAGGSGDLVLKQEGTATISEYEDKTFKLAPAPSQTCKGDSGGPAFMTVDGVEYQVGITRSGDPDCMVFARDTRVDVFVDSFIEPFIRHSGVGVAELGDRCYYPANCVSNYCMAAPDDGRIHYCSRECGSSADCPLDMYCDNTDNGARCLIRTPTPGALGSSCSDDTQCEDSTCARVFEGDALECRQPCAGDFDVFTCLDGQYCEHIVGDAERFACTMPVEDNGFGVGCSTSSGDSRTGFAFGLLALGLVTRRRRRR